MIVISGALVLVALVLLIIGVVSTELPFVYASIAVSLVSLVFLVIGILQRRGETVPVAEAAGAAAPQPAEDPADSVTAVIPAQGGRRTAPARAADEPAETASADEELAASGTVLVVAGRPRYHVGGCRYLTGKAAEPVAVRDAREEGFSPCGVCKPDESLEQAAAVAAPSDAAPTGGTRAVTPAKAAKSAPRRASTRASAGTSSTARKAPATKVAAARTAKAPARGSGAKAPTRAAAAAAAAGPAAQTAAKRPGSVVVIPDRGKFHTADCRYVRDVDGAEVLSKTAATRQGYTACGVCKP